MKAFFGASFLVLVGANGPCSAQEATLDFAKLRLNGLPFTTTKAQVLHRLGKPVTIDEPKYECGFLSSQEQGQRFYSLHYPQAVFTGNAKAGYVMEEVRFLANAPTVLMYGSRKLSAKTTLHDLEKAFGHKLRLEKIRTGKTKYEPMVSLRSRGDDAANFWFKGGHLVRFEYWTPC